MKNRKKITISDPTNIYHELALALHQYCECEKLSKEFVVEGTLVEPLIVIKYPGKKLRKREGNVRLKYGNLYDFLVIPYVNKKPVDEKYFTYRKMLRDFIDNKKDNDDFWFLIKELYEDNTLSKKPPQLPGINSEIYLFVLKWLWIQEDLNYRLDWKEIDSPIRYMLLNKSGNRTAKGAGRGKFFAGLILAKYHYNYFKFNDITKIIP